jgi:hypothetical protein
VGPGLVTAAADASEVLAQVGLSGQLTVLALMLGSTIWAAVRPGPAASVSLLLCAAVWSRANSQLEGRILVTFTATHGLTLADLLVPALLGLVLTHGTGGGANRSAAPEESGMLDQDRAARPRKGRAGVDHATAGPVPAETPGGGLPAGNDLQVLR